MTFDPPPTRTARGPIAWMLRLGGHHAVCLPPVGVYALPGFEADARLRRHECAHWDQAVRMGTLRWYVTLLAQYARHGYRNAPLEVEARLAEARAPSMEQ